MTTEQDKLLYIANALALCVSLMLLVWASNE